MQTDRRIDNPLTRTLLAAALATGAIGFTPSSAGAQKEGESVTVQTGGERLTAKEERVYDGGQRLTAGAERQKEVSGTPESPEPRPLFSGTLFSLGVAVTRALNDASRPGRR